MRTLTFKSGIHPPDSKKYSSDRATREIWPKKGATIIYPMVQHIGAPCKPTVKKGDRVLIGQKIGEATAFVSVPIHASISGTVTNIAPCATPGGAVVESIFVENDALNEEIDTINIPVDYKSIPREDLFEIIKEAGIVGMGGAGFPTHIKLNTPSNETITHILINAAECEPFITTDHRSMLENSDAIIRGVKIVQHLHPTAKAFICVENNKMDAILKMDEICKEIENIEVVALETKYPQGAEKQLILALTGKEVPSGKLPSSVGCSVLNIDTVIAIDRAITRGRPLMRRIITITGDAVLTPGNYKVRLGMKYSDLLQELGGFKSDPYKFISGGPMMGTAMYDLDIPMTKGSSALICFSEEAGKIPEERNCIRCGRCVSGCPAGLVPCDLDSHIRHDDYISFVKYNGIDCIECGSCSYVCPAKIQLAQSIRMAKRKTLQK